MKTTFIPSSLIVLLAWQRAALWLCATGVLSLALIGCSPTHTQKSTIDPTGTFDLVSVDGKPVPCEVSHGGQAMEVKSGEFTISPDGSCSSKTTFTVTGHEAMVREVKATYTQSGTKLTMQWEGAGTTIGEVTEGAFTMNNEGMILQYRKGR